MLRVKNQKHQKNKIPNGFIKKRRVHLNEGTCIGHDGIFPNLHDVLKCLRLSGKKIVDILNARGRIEAVCCIPDVDPHREQAVRIRSEAFAVEEIPPTADDLPG